MLSRRPSITAYYHHIRKEINEEIRKRHDSYILSVIPDDYIEYLFLKYCLIEVEFDEDREISIEKVRKEREYSDEFRERRVHEFIQIRVTVPIIQNPKIDDIVQLQPSKGYTNAFNMVHSSGSLVFETEPTEQRVEVGIERMKEEIENRNTDVKRENGELFPYIKRAFEARKSLVQNEEDLLESIATKVAVKLKRKEDASSYVPTALEPKDKIRPIAAPKAAPPKRLYLPRDKFNGILSLIDNSCRLFERTPVTFAKLEEEELRDVILSNLNGVFEGDAVGEAFSNRGKTDIFLKVREGGIFIAECKYWKGPKTVGATVEQLLNYLTWRNSFGVLVLFSKRKNFTSIVAKLGQEIPNLDSNVKGFKQVSDSHYSSINHLPGDKGKLIEVHYMIYSLYTDG